MLSGPLTTVLGAVADGVAVLAVVFGVAGALGMGILQLMAGLHHVIGTPTESPGMMAGVLVAITVAFVLSASTSLDRGIQILSNINMALAVGLLVYILLVGPTGFLMRTFTTSIGDYLAAGVDLSRMSGSGSEPREGQPLRRRR